VVGAAAAGDGSAMMAQRDDLSMARVVDVVFPLHGQALPDEPMAALCAALQQTLPWLARETLAGVHLLRLVHGMSRRLSPRTRLLLRVPRERMKQIEELAGRKLLLEGEALLLGLPRARELMPHATLYAHAVADPHADEHGFMQGVAAQLQAMGVHGHAVCGRQQQRQIEGRTWTTHSLMLHALNPVDSLRVQEYGLGPYRLLGCGLFVPHKSAAAVSE